MTNEIDAFAIDKNGVPCLKELLDPFFKTIAPALFQKADQISIKRGVFNNSVKISIEYSKNGAIHNLPPHREFNPAIAFIRIRILADMALESQETQAGTIRVKIGDENLSVDLSLGTKDDWEILNLRPNWSAA